MTPHTRAQSPPSSISFPSLWAQGLSAEPPWARRGQGHGDRSQSCWHIRHAGHTARNERTVAALGPWHSSLPELSLGALLPHFREHELTRVRPVGESTAEHLDQTLLGL